MGKKVNTEASFESNMTALEELVKGMEGGKVVLDDLVKEYERGSKLLKTCEEQLKGAELKISKLKEGGSGEKDLETFELEH